jgi:hypothetical protein
VPRANFADNPVGLAACYLRPRQPRLILFSLDLMTRATATKSTDPEEQLRTFIDKFEPKPQCGGQALYCECPYDEHLIDEPRTKT